MMTELGKRIETAPEAIRNATARLRMVVRETMKPPPRLTLSQWADEKRVLSPEFAARPGRWKTSRVEYLREILDSCSNPLVEEVVMMSSAQVGKTSVIE